MARDSYLRFVGVGDVNLQHRADPGGAFARVAAELAAADMLYGNLEGPLAGAADRNPIPHKRGWVHSDPTMVSGLRDAGFAFVSCASNVTYPPSAALRSLAVLDAHAIAHAGAGRTLAEARRPAIVERRGLRCGLLSYTSVFWPHGHAAGPESPGVATVRIDTAYEPGPRVLEMPGAAPTVRTTPDPEELAACVRDITKLRPQVDLLVVAMHWGISGSTGLAEYQRTVGHAAVDAGADLVLGCPPARTAGHRGPRAAREARDTRGDLLQPGKLHLRLACHARPHRRPAAALPARTRAGGHRCTSPACRSGATTPVSPRCCPRTPHRAGTWRVR